MTRDKVFVTVDTANRKDVSIGGRGPVNKIAWVRVNTDSPAGTDLNIELMVKSQPHNGAITIELSVPSELIEELRIKVR